MTLKLLDQELYFLFQRVRALAAAGVPEALQEALLKFITGKAGAAVLQMFFDFRAPIRGEII
ncbi:MAG: hypothetical protein HY548_05365 [Elusimicrobia bacterium]|nr:hypothetical protein [Elusimicrobiota bacterium]